MNMKLNVIAAACLAMCASSAFAVTAPAPATPAQVCAAALPTQADVIVNNCTPQVKMFIGGSSALGGSLSTVVKNDLFDTTAQPIITVVDKSASAQAGNTSAWFGKSKSSLTGGASKWLYVVYNKNNGSAAGVSLLLSKVGTVPEGTVVSVGPLTAKANGSNSCVLAGTSTTLVPVVNCATTDVATAADLAISDVHPSELYKLYATATAKVSTLTMKPLAMQGMGLGVSWNLYQALQVRNVAEGLIDSTCVAGDLSAKCQPTVRSADYTSLITKQGLIKTAATFLGDAADSTPLTLARRDDLSGTQASSNIFFADNSCGGMGYGAGGTNYGVVSAAGGFNFNPVTGKLDKLVSAAMGGGLNIIESAVAAAAPAATGVARNDTTSYPGLIIMSAVAGGDVTNALNSAIAGTSAVAAVPVAPAVLATAADLAAGTVSSVTKLPVVAVGEVITPAVTTAVNALPATPASYAIGAISLTSAPANTVNTWKFVKIDGVSPNFKADGSLDTTQRLQFANGNYPFAVQSYAAYPIKPVAGSVNDAVKGAPAVLQAVITGLQSSVLHNLTGIAYQDGTAAASTISTLDQQAHVHRTAGNNCSPLIK